MYPSKPCKVAQADAQWTVDNTCGIRVQSLLTAAHFGIFFFTGDASDLERDLFIRSADNSKFMTLRRALCMLLIFLMTFSQIFGSLKKLAMHFLVLDTVSDPVSFFVAFVASCIKKLVTDFTDWCLSWLQ